MVGCGKSCWHDFGMGVYFAQEVPMAKKKTKKKKEEPTEPVRNPNEPVLT